MKLVVRFLAMAMLTLAFAGCTGNGAVPAPPPTVAPQQVQHLYVASAGPVQNQIAVFLLPLSNASTPAYNITGATSLNSICFDSKGNLFAIDQSAKAEYFAAPVSSASVPAATFSAGSAPIACTVDGSGSLYVSDNSSSTINVFHPPFSNATTAAFAMSTNVGSPRGIGFDGVGRLFVSNANNVGVITPPFSNASAAVIFGTAQGFGLNQGVMADAAGNIYQSNGTAMGHIDVYSAPVNTSAVTSNFHITLPGGSSEPLYATFDQNGNMYVTANISGATILEYSPPFSASSAPKVQFSTSNAYGVAIGP
jgi:streptogramin lyase